MATKQCDVVGSPEENHPVIGHVCKGELPGAVQKVAQIKLGKVLSPLLPLGEGARGKIGHECDVPREESVQPVTEFSERHTHALRLHKRTHFYSTGRPLFQVKPVHRGGGHFAVVFSRISPPCARVCVCVCEWPVVIGQRKAPKGENIQNKK